MTGFVSTQVESWTAILPELKLLFPLHWDSMARNKDRVPLSPDYVKYGRLEQLGQLVVVTIRRRSLLIGYWVEIVDLGLHYSGSIFSTMDMWFIVPEYINGAAPLVLIRAVEREMRRRGVFEWMAGSKDHKPCARLYELNGMERFETYYAKRLDK